MKVEERVEEAVLVFCIVEMKQTKGMVQFTVVLAWLFGSKWQQPLNHLSTSETFKRN